MSDDSLGDRELDGALVLGVVLLTLLHWGSLALRLPLAQSLPGWFLGYSELPFGSIWPLPLLLGSLVAAAVLVFRRSQATRSVLFVLFGLGFVLQVGLSALEGRGLDALRDPLVRIGGHGEMFDVAIAEPSLFEVVENYETYSASDRLMHYAQSKPPGFILGYMLTERVAGLGQELDPVARKNARGDACGSGVVAVELRGGVSAFLFCALVLERSGCDGGEPAVFGGPECSVDQRASRPSIVSDARDPDLGDGGPRHAKCVMGPDGWGGSRTRGFDVYQFFVAARCTTGGGGSCGGRLDGSMMRAPDAALLFPAAWSLRGALLPCCWFSVLRSIMTRFCVSRMRWAYHAAWKSLPADMRTVVYTSILNWIEFGTWLGVPISFAWAGGTLMSLSAFLRREERPIDLLMLGTALVVFLMCAFGRTMAEVARLWMFPRAATLLLHRGNRNPIPARQCRPRLGWTDCPSSRHGSHAKALLRHLIERPDRSTLRA